jgi:hypothetical protein
VQEPVAWDVFNGICHHSTHGTESSAKAMAAEMQKNHDLSGSIAAFKVKPRMPTLPAAQRQWVGLTAAEQRSIEKKHIFVEDAIRLTEAKLKNKNAAAQPVIPDAMTSADIQEHIEYVAGWNDCRQAMMEMMK